jgi:short-subunit dehydrogenase
VAFRQLDVTDAEATTRVLGEAVESFGAPDLLVNSAGFARPGAFDELTAENLVTSFQINLLGPWNATQALLDPLRQGGGTILNVSSVAGLIGVYGLSDYCATKFGVVGFSEALRQELAPYKVRVQVLCPPDTDTPGLEQENTTKPAETKAVSGSARLFTAEEVAAAAIRGLSRKRFLIIPERMSRFALAVKSVAPGIFFRAMDGIVRGAQRRAARERNGISMRKEQ